MKTFEDLTFVNIEAGSYRLGLDATGLSAFELGDDYADIADRFSAARTVELPAFAIASAAVSVDQLLRGHDDATDRCDGLTDVIALLDRLLAPSGLAVPTEDQLEAAIGPALFPWGAAQIPAGSPYPIGDGPHQGVMPSGLTLDGDTYQVEIVKTALKLGDGGEAVCGGYDDRLAWLALSTPYRMVGEAVEDLLFEFLEGSWIRPVRAAL